MAPPTAGPYSPADPSDPGRSGGLFPLIATVGLILIGMAGTIWGPVYYGQRPGRSPMTCGPPLSQPSG